MANEWRPDNSSTLHDSSVDWYVHETSPQLFQCATCCREKLFACCTHRCRALPTAHRFVGLLQQPIDVQL